jgi:hypothetical protein
MANEILPTETVKAFMDRMFTQDMRTLKPEDWSMMGVLALMGAQEMIKNGGDGVLVPSKEYAAPPPS